MNSRISVLHIISSFSAGGIEKWLLDMSKFATIDQRVEFRFLCISGNKALWDDDVPAPIYYQPNLKSGKLLFFFSALIFFFRIRKNVDIVHIHLYRFSAIVAFILKLSFFKKVVVHAHNDKRAMARKRPRFKRMIMFGYEVISKTLFWLFADVCVAAGAGAADDVFGAINRKKTEIMYCGVEMRGFASGAARRKLEKLLGLEGDAKALFTVGSLTKQKNHEFLLQIFEQLIKQKPLAKLFIIGEGSLRPCLEKQIKEKKLQDNVFLIGNRNDVQSILQNVSDGFLFPSLYEGLGLALVEAQYCGNRCFISDAVPVEAEVEPKLIRRFDLEVSSWVTGIVEEWDLLSRKFTCTTGQNKFSLDVTYSNFVELYVKLVTGK